MTQRIPIPPVHTSPGYHSSEDDLIEIVEGYDYSQELASRPKSQMREASPIPTTYCCWKLTKADPHGKESPTWKRAIKVQMTLPSGELAAQTKKQRKAKSLTEMYEALSADQRQHVEILLKEKRCDEANQNATWELAAIHRETLNHSKTKIRETIFIRVILSREDKRKVDERQRGSKASMKPDGLSDLNDLPIVVPQEISVKKDRNLGSKDIKTRAKDKKAADSHGAVVIAVPDRFENSRGAVTNHPISYQVPVEKPRPRTVRVLSESGLDRGQPTYYQYHMQPREEQAINLQYGQQIHQGSGYLPYIADPRSGVHTDAVLDVQSVQKHSLPHQLALPNGIQPGTPLNHPAHHASRPHLMESPQIILQTPMPDNIQSQEHTPQWRQAIQNSMHYMGRPSRQPDYPPQKLDQPGVQAYNQGQESQQRFSYPEQKIQQQTLVQPLDRQSAPREYNQGYEPSSQQTNLSCTQGPEHPIPQAPMPPAWPDYNPNAEEPISSPPQVQPRSNQVKQTSEHLSREDILFWRTKTQLSHSRSNSSLDDHSSILASPDQSTAPSSISGERIALPRRHTEKAILPYPLDYSKMTATKPEHFDYRSPQNDNESWRHPNNQWQYQEQPQPQQQQQYPMTSQIDPQKYNPQQQYSHQNIPHHSDNASPLLQQHPTLSPPPLPTNTSATLDLLNRNLESMELRQAETATRKAIEAVQKRRERERVEAYERRIQDAMAWKDGAQAQAPHGNVGGW
jgi:hypothetical protein